MRLEKGNEKESKLPCEKNIVCDFKMKMEQREKELIDLKNYVRVLEELFQRTRDRQHFIAIESSTLTEIIKPSHN